MPVPVLAVVGGSGLYSMAELSEVERLQVDTPYGPPSDVITRGRIGPTTVLFLPRHGNGHRFAPHAINYRANVCALKILGATHLASISAVGSLREDAAPGHFVVVDQYIDRTTGRANTFFDTGVVAHVSMADPVCPELSKAAVRAATRAGARVHPRGTYVCIEGPQFSTRAESELYRSWRADVIGMTALPEAKLAREAGLAYTTVALVTDYDCWHESEAEVSVELVLEVSRRNVEMARRAIVELCAELPNLAPSPAASALKHAVMTESRAMDAPTRSRLAWLLDT